MALLDKKSQKGGFKGTEGFYRPLLTADGSMTFHSERFDEAFHSLDGARGETRHNFVEGCEIPSCNGERPLSILEVGLGMGRGYTETVLALGADFAGELTFVSLEIDPVLIEWCQLNVPLPPGCEGTFPSYQHLQRKTDRGVEYWEAVHRRTRLLILSGDATETLPTMAKAGHIPLLDAIYQDAFSPRKNPELWTHDWFELLRSLSSPTVILSTYSVSSEVKDTLGSLGFGFLEREGFGRKRACLKVYGYGICEA